MAVSLSEAFENLRVGEIETIIMQKLEEGVDPLCLIRECQEAMGKIGKKFETEEYYLAELILSAKMFEKASELLYPKLVEKERRTYESLGKIVLGTPKGDIHDLGKNIFRVMAKATGFEVIDLGIDVPVEKFIYTVQQQNPEIVGMSGLLTTTYSSMKEIVDLLVKRGLREKVNVIIGGGAMGEQARRYVGADAYTLDAYEGTQICQKFVRSHTSREKGGRP